MAVDLRDRRRLASLLVLRELAFAPGTSLRSVAARLGVTVQAVSVHARRLADEGLLARDADGYALTAGGHAALHEGFGELKQAVDETIARMAVIRVASAVAAAPIRAGEEVGLFMEQGELVARPGRRSPSMGRAAHDAEVGDEVAVRNLSGVVELAPARLVVVRVPAPEEGGSRVVSPRRLKALLRERGLDPDRVGALGTPARVLARRLGLGAALEFAPAEAAFHAAQLGLPALLLVSREHLRDALAEIDARNGRAPVRVPVEILDAPQLASRREAAP